MRAGARHRHPCQHKSKWSHASLIPWATIRWKTTGVTKVYMHSVQNIFMGGAFLEAPKEGVNPSKKLAVWIWTLSLSTFASNTVKWLNVFLDSSALTTHSLRKVPNRRKWIMPSIIRGESSAWFYSGPPCMETSYKRMTWLWPSWRYVRSPFPGYIFVL